MVPEISIIIPVYNGSQYLGSTIQSVIGQSFGQFELLVVNDGSTDNTEGIIRDAQKSDSRIFYYERPHSGVSSTRNFGLERARGEFVVFLDSDDLLKPDFLQTRIAYLQNNPQTGFCGSGVGLIDENGHPLAGSMDMYAPGEQILEDILFYQSRVTTVPSNLMHRRKLLMDNNIRFDPRLSSSADRLFLCKLANITTAHCLPVKNLCYRVHLSSMYHNPAGKKIIFKDNERYVQILMEEDIVPANMKGHFLARNYYMLAGAGKNAQLYTRSVVYGIKYLWHVWNNRLHRFQS